ncbi:hypothetical protein LC613_28760 [Nostoc sphaeroides CHAB 2801]|uniref:hypothetical protein n=1 Tax=Nostoc sphaeroides TaxID=446679 RepID=UPI000E4681A8|nr:hypothetical protein [Nostoc sphaeroides]MCC5631712.1 hypothetical protein [Nostoc sphaeroides CHAB 2801]
MRDLDMLKHYLELLSGMWDGCEVRFADGKILRRMDNIIWESIHFITEKDEINKETIEGEEEV